MHVDKKTIDKIILQTLTDLVETLPEDEQFIPNYDTKLFGQGALVDSLMLVSFIVDLESIFSSEYDFDIILTDDRAMTREISPFDNVSNLTEYINEIIQEQN